MARTRRASSRKAGKQGRNWIQSAIKRPGALTKKARAAGQSVMAFARRHRQEGGTTGRQSRLAITLSKLRKRKK